VWAERRTTRQQQLTHQACSMHHPKAHHLPCFIFMINFLQYTIRSDLLFTPAERKPKCHYKVISL